MPYLSTHPGPPILCRFAAALFGFLLAAAVPVAAEVRLPDIGDPANSVFSAADDRALGDAFMREVRAHVAVIDDPEVEAYIQGLGDRLTAHLRGPSGAFHYFVVRDRSINAFAGPGGHIGVNSGLILLTESESELASVLAHETAHVTQHHIARGIVNARRSNIPALAGLLAAIVIGIKNPQAGRATLAGLTGLNAQRRINFTRSNELEADRVGMQILHDSGFDANAMPVFFERLQNTYRFTRRPPAFLLDHPVTGERIADARARAAQFPYRQYVDSAAYALVRAKLRVITASDPRTALRYFAGQAKDQGGDAGLASRYGRALALARTGESAAANALLDELIKEKPQRIAFRLARADNELRSGDGARAVARYAAVFRLYPDDAAVVRGYANALVQMRRAKQAVRVLLDYRHVHALSAPLLRLLAKAYQATGQVAESKLALAEQFYKNGDLDAAIRQLELGRRSPGDYYVRSKIDARIESLRQEQILRTKRR